MPPRQRARAVRGDAVVALLLEGSSVPRLSGDECEHQVGESAFVPRRQQEADITAGAVSTGAEKCASFRNRKVHHAPVEK